MSLSFTTTATVRPELLEQTYRSFCSNLTGVNFKDLQLFINVDPVPTSSEADRLKVVAVAQKYFGRVTPNFPAQGNFPAALHWAWTNVVGDWIFHLEDDWILTEKVDIRHLIEMLERSPKAIGVKLNAYVFGFNLDRICLSPGLIRGDWARQAAQHLRPIKCPEKQLRSSIPKSLVRPMLNYPSYSSKKDGRIIVRDIGRLWRIKHKLAKDIDKSKGFTTWKQQK
jgi:hypothetical protein